MRLDSSVLMGDREPDALWRILHRNRFEGAILCPWQYTREETEAHLALAERIDWIRGVVGVPGSPDHPRLIGIEARWPNLEAIHEATARSLVADVSCGMLSLANIAKFAAQHERARLTILRLGGARFATSPNSATAAPATAPIAAPDPVWEDGLTQLAACPNVRLKINGLLNDAPPGDPTGWGPASLGWRVEHYKPWISTALRLFGEGRVLYGSDWPVCMDRGATWKESMACFTQSMGPRTQEYREAILGGSAMEWYRLSA